MQYGVRQIALMNVRILRKSLTIVCALLFVARVDGQVLSAESQGIAGIQSTTDGAESVWHNFAFLSQSESLSIHITSSMPYLIDGILMSGVGAKARHVTAQFKLSSHHAIAIEPIFLQRLQKYAHTYLN